jgi:hypothetical protein
VARGVNAARRGRPWLVAAAALAGLSLLLFWPGVADYDSVEQFGQAVAGRYDDWHPPIMAALWRLLHRLVGGGQGPMLALQLGGWWAGLGLIAAALAGTGRPRAAAAVLAVGCWPPLLGWQAQVLKDAQMAAALLLATGLVAAPRLRGRPMGPIALAAMVVLLAYAALVRANAIFSVAPLGALLMPRRWGAWRGAAALALLAAGLGAAGPVNHGVFDAERSGVERTAALFDLAGIAARTPIDRPLPLTGAERQAIVRLRCATPFFWDPLGEDSRCAPALSRPWSQPPGALYRDLARAIAAAPIAYARHRLAHLNSTERWLVPASWPAAAPPMRSQPNPLGLGTPGAWGAAFARLAGVLIDTPLTWPITWSIIAVAAALTALRRPPAAARDLALALAGSAVGQEASFLTLSIASDWRYHLWPILAAALAALLLADRPPPRRIAWGCGMVLALVMVAGLLTRALLTPAPSFGAMMDGASAAAVAF